MCPPQNKTSPPFKRVRIMSYDSILTQRTKLSKWDVFTAHCTLTFLQFWFQNRSQNQCWQKYDVLWLAVSSRTFKYSIFKVSYYMNLFDLYFKCIYIYNHIWWGWQGGGYGELRIKRPRPNNWLNHWKKINILALYRIKYIL